MLKFGGNRIRRRTMVASHRLAVVLTQRSSSTTSVAPPPFWSSPFRWYSNKLDTHPILTKCVSSGLVASTGNLLAQRIAYNITNTTTLEEEKEAFVVDWTKVGQFAFLNVTFVAPVLHHWYQWVNKAIPGIGLWAVCQRVFVDEFLFTPIYLPIFMGGLWSIEGTEWKRVQDMLMNEMPSVIIAEWVLWVPTMFVTFRYAPVKYQVLVINCVCVGWHTFLSLVASEAHTKHDNCDEPLDKVKQKPHSLPDIAVLADDTADPKVPPSSSA